MDCTLIRRICYVFTLLVCAFVFSCARVQAQILSPIVSPKTQTFVSGTWTLATWITPTRTYCDDPTGLSNAPGTYLSCTRSICNDSVGLGTGDGGACTPTGLAAGLAGIIIFVNNNDSPNITARQIASIFLCSTLDSGVCDSTNSMVTVTIWHTPLGFVCNNYATISGGGSVSIDCGTFTSVGGEKYYTVTRTDNGQHETMQADLFAYSTTVGSFHIESISTQSDNFTSTSHTMVSSSSISGNVAIAQGIVDGNNTTSPSVTSPYTGIFNGNGTHFGFAHVENVNSGTSGLDPTWVSNESWTATGVAVVLGEH